MSHNIGTLDMQNNKIIRLASGTGLSDAVNYGQISALTGAAPGTVSAGTASVELGQVVFSNSNGLSFGLNGSTVTASHNGLTSQSNQALSASNGSFAFQTAAFSNANNVTFGTSAGSIITASVNTGLTSQSNQAASASNGSFAFQTVGFSNANNVTFGTSAGSIITASVNTGLTSQSNQAASASNGSFAFQTLAFSNANNVTFGTSAGSIITASISPGGAGDGVNIIAAGTQTANTTGTVLFENSNGITFGMSNSSVVTASHNGLTSQSNQAASASNGSFAFQTVGFSNANNVTFGTSAGSIITASVQTPLTVSSTVIGADRGFSPSGAEVFSLVQNVVNICPAALPVDVAMSQVKVPVTIGCSTSNAGTHRRGYTAQFGIYSRHPSSSTVITQHYSTSYTVAVSASTNTRFGLSCITGVENSTSYNSQTQSSAGVNATAFVNGARELGIACVTTLTAGEWWFAFHQSSSSAGVAGQLFNISQRVASSVSGNRFGLSPNASTIGLGRDIGLGYYSVTTAALPAGMTLTSDIYMQAINPFFYCVAVSN